MESKSPKKSSDEKETTGCSLKKHLAVATIAASLGVSLGVPVGDVMAGSQGMNQGRPGISRQDNQYMNSGQLKVSNQLKVKGALESNGGQLNRQNAIPSSQGKIESTQIKLDSTDKTNVKAGQNQVGK